MTSIVDSFPATDVASKYLVRAIGQIVFCTALYHYDGWWAVTLWLGFVGATPSWWWVRK